MRVHFYLADQNPHRDRTLGITRYTEGLLAELSTEPQLELSCLVSRSSYQPPFERVAIQRLPFATDHVLGRLLADHLHPLFVRSDARLWHFPKGFLPYLRRPSAAVVGTVADTILDHHAEHYPALRSRAAYHYWLGLLAHSLARFDLVLTLSEFSRRSIESFCERRGVRCPPIEITYPGGRWERPSAEPFAKGDAAVHLSSVQPHKRTDTLLEFWARLQAERETWPRLELIGGLLDAQREKLARLQHVEHTPHLPDGELERRLAAARVLLLPSEIEGFGLPALEAYYLGTPVLYVLGTAVEEVLDTGCPGGFDLRSYESFRDALDDALGLGDDFVARKAAALRERFAWRRCRERTLAAYRRVA